MPKTLPIPRPVVTRPATSRREGASAGAIALFAVAYIAVLGILFAPDGFFTESPTTFVADSAD